jgi:hypothetical protein
MNTKKEKKQEVPNWIADITNVEKKLEVEAFATNNDYKPILIDQDEQKLICQMYRQYKQGRATYSFPLKLDIDVNEDLEKFTKGSKNACIVEILRFGIAELKKRKKTLTNE